MSEIMSDLTLNFNEHTGFWEALLLLRVSDEAMRREIWKDLAVRGIIIPNAWQAEMVVRQQHNALSWLERHNDDGVHITLVEPDPCEEAMTW